MGHRGDWGGIAPGSMKSEFRRLGKRFLAELAAQLELPSGSYEVRFNPAGPACSGESWLHSADIYVQVSAGTDLGILFRSCRSRKDSCGGPNYWWPIRDDFDMEIFVHAVQSIRHGTCPC